MRDFLKSQSEYYAKEAKNSRRKANLYLLAILVLSAILMSLLLVC